MNKEIEEAAKAYAYKIINVLDDYARDFDSAQYGLPTGLESGNDKVNEMVNLVLPILNQWPVQQPLSVKPVEDERRIKDVLLGLLNYIDVTGSSIKESSIFKDADVFLNTYRPLPAPVKAVEGETITGVDKDAAAEPIQNALYATGRFTAEACCNITDGILDYLKDAEMFIVHKQVKPPVKWLDESYEPGTKEVEKALTAETRDKLLDLIDRARSYNDGWVFKRDELLEEYQKPLPYKSVETKELTGEEMVSKAWTYLAKGGIVTNKEKGDCFPALSVLRALQIAAGVTPNEPNTTRHP